jgi:hypothetical protein
MCCANRPDSEFNPETDSGVWWLSFAGDTGFLGVVIVPATGFLDAVGFCWHLGINPGGEVQGSMLPKDDLPAEHLRCCLLSEQELDAAGFTKRVD